MNNKKGQMAIVWTVGIVLVLAVVAYGIFAIANSAGGGADDGGSGDLDETNNCETAPYLSLNGVNVTNKGQAVSGESYSYRKQLDDGTWSSSATLTSGSSGTSFNKGDLLQILVTQGASINKILHDEEDPYEVKTCAQNDVYYDIVPTDTATFKCFSDAVSLSDDDTSPSNGISSSATTVSIDCEIATGADKGNDVTWISVEFSNKTQIQDIKMSESSSWLTITSESLPRSFTDENTTTANYVEQFRVSGIKRDGAKNEFQITFEPASGETMGTPASGLYIVGRTEQAFTDTDGTFAVGVEDMDGTSQSADSFDFDNVFT